MPKHQTVIKYIGIFLFALLQQAHAQDINKYPPGITIDPAIEKAFTKKKADNFKVIQYVNDTVFNNPILGAWGMMPLAAVSINKGDTLFTVMNMLIPWGFQIQLGRDSTGVEIFVSSRSCKCFKSSLSEAEASYGAGTPTGSLKLVINKLHNLKKGDKLYGYIQATSGPIYHFGDYRDNSKYEKWRFTYEGYFAIKFDPVGN